MGTLGAAAMATLLTAVVLLTVHVPLATVATDHVVGGSMWSIPLRDDLYMAWSNNRTFYAGDNLVFRFQIGFYDVVQVSRREYEDCTTDDPYNNFRVPPAVVPLDYKGVRYYVCSVGNYCKLGLKFHVTIQQG
ncbi:Cupredoxin superfamily protein [Zea mays]|uniref:Cupredoxin superfamily protein n=2 Tax=Zea mays TaxID=4577 RepID=A0A1D6KWY2_MAIZE|nr:Cupredoxin superfamily protein [Zea mays]